MDLIKKILSHSFIKKSSDKPMTVREAELMGITYLHDCLKGQIKQMKFHRDLLILKELDLTVRLHIEDVISQPTHTLVQLKFITDVSSLDVEIVETLAGICEGNSLEDAVKQGVLSFREGAFESILNLVQNEVVVDHTFETRYTKDNSATKWHFRYGKAQYQGSPAVDWDLYSLLQSEIQPKLGNKRFYWLKVYCARQIDGSVQVECLINNERFHTAQDKINNYLLSLPKQESFQGFKQYWFISKDEASLKTKTYTKQELYTAINKAIDLMSNCTKPAEIDVAFDKLLNQTNDLPLAFELYCFIPELYAQLKYPMVRFSDEWTFVFPSGDTKSLYTSQIDLMSMILNTLRNREKLGIGHKKLDHLLNFSSQHNAIQNATANGSSLENLVLMPLILNAPDGYDAFR